MELFTNNGISHIASGVGVPLFMDKATQLITRLSFARVYVEVAQDSSLPSSIQVEIEGFRSMEVTVEYPWKSMFCTVCKLARHEDCNCKNSKKVWRFVSQKVDDPYKTPNTKSAQNDVDAAKTGMDTAQVGVDAAQTGVDGSTPTESVHNGAEGSSDDPLNSTQSV